MEENYDSNQINRILCRLDYNRKHRSLGYDFIRSVFRNKGDEMREILFRGQRVDAKKWTYGYYFMGFTGIPYILVLHDHILGMTEFYEVIPETVGQFTGLLDKNGVKIFEGDIVVCRYANEYTPVFQNGIYMAYNPKEMQTIQQPSTQFNIIWRNGCEVIGNIHDNPELLS